MDVHEFDGVPACIECGTILSKGTGPPYAISGRGALCHECALRRGGEYEASCGEWTTEPDLDALTLLDSPETVL